MIERATRIAYEYLHIDEENISILSKLMRKSNLIFNEILINLSDRLTACIKIKLAFAK